MSMLLVWQNQHGPLHCKLISSAYIVNAANNSLLGGGGGNMINIYDDDMTADTLLDSGWRHP